MNKSTKGYIAMTLIMVAGILAPYPFTSIPALLICLCIAETCDE